MYVGVLTLRMVDVGVLTLRMVNVCVLTVRMVDVGVHTVRMVAHKCCDSILTLFAVWECS